MPGSEFQMRQKNAKFANDARAGKKPTKMSRIEKQAKQSPIPAWTLGVILFVVCGGVIFELARLVFV